MIKMGKTKYETALGNLCAPDIIKRLEKAKATKRNRSLGYTCASIRAKYAGIDVQLFFYKKGNGCWNALITMDMDIDFVHLGRRSTSVCIRTMKWPRSSMALMS